MPRKFTPLGGIAVVASNTYAAIQGRDALEDRVGRWPQRHLRLGCVQQGDGGDGGAARQGDPQPGRCGRGLQGGKGTFTGEYYSAASRAGADGAAGGASRASPTARRRCGRPFRARTAPARTSPRSLKVPIENVTVHVTLLGGGFGRKSKWDFMIEAALAVAEARRHAGAAAVDARGRYPPLRSTTRPRSSASRWPSTTAGKVTGWRHRTRGAVDHLDLHGGRRLPVPIEYGMGFVEHAVRHPQRPLRERQGDGAHAHRLVPLGVEHPARLRGAVGRRGARHRARPGSQGLPARADRARSQARPARPWGSPRTSGTTATPTKSSRSTPARLKNVVRIAAEKAGWGKKLPAGEGLGIAAHRRLADVRRDRRACGRRRGRQPSACRKQRRRSIAASTSIRSASARRSRAPR